MNRKTRGPSCGGKLGPATGDLAGAKGHCYDTTSRTPADLVPIRAARAEALLRWVAVLNDNGLDLSDDNYALLRGRGLSRLDVDRAVGCLVLCDLARLEVSAGWLAVRLTDSGANLARALREAPR